MQKKAIAVEPTTLQELSELSLAKNLPDKSIIQLAINQLWQRTFPQIVIPKKEHKKYLKRVTGKKGPYQVSRTYQSWTGLSEGMHRLEGCDLLFPVKWFTIDQPKAPSRITFNQVMLVTWTVVQIIFMVYLKLSLGI